MKKLLLVVLTLLFPLTALAEQCRTILLPPPTTPSLTIMVPPGVTYLIDYHYPPNASSVGLMFWTHMFPDATGDMWLAAYVNDPSNSSRRIGTWHKNGEPVMGNNNLAMSIRMNPGEQFVVSLVNSTGAERELYFGVTIRECYP